MRRARTMERLDGGTFAVVIGDGIGVLFAAVRLWLSDTPCVIFLRGRRTLNRLLPFDEVVCFDRDCSYRLIAERLCGLADRYPDGRKTLFTDAAFFEGFSASEMDELESRYILKTGEDKATRLYGSGA